MKLIADLGCYGFKTKQLYFDIHFTPAFQCFVNDGVFRRWYSLPTMRLLRTQVVDPENAVRIARRTLKPWAIVKDIRGEEWECISYPFFDGCCDVMVRRPGQEHTLRRMDITRLPLQFRPRITGVPANDPLS